MLTTPRSSLHFGSELTCFLNQLRRMGVASLARLTHHLVFLRPPKMAPVSIRIGLEEAVVQAAHGFFLGRVPQSGVPQLLGGGGGGGGSLSQVSKPPSG